MGSAEGESAKGESAKGESPAGDLSRVPETG